MFITETVDYYIENYGDPRTKHWFLVRTPWPCLTLISLYLLTIKVFLPAYMKNRAPYKLTNVIFYYNLFQVIYSAYLLYMGFFCGWVKRFPLFICREIDRSTDPDAMMAATGVYWYYIAKLTEFLDTIFFVLRKKDSQISFLHVYHHSSMAFHGWLGTMFLPGGVSTIAVGINSCIHIVMYTYYLLSGLGPKWQKYLWWKKYLTSFQIIQFIFGIFYIPIIYLSRDKCPEYFSYYPLLYWAVLYVSSLLYLFTKFYIVNYLKTKMIKPEKMNGYSKPKEIIDSEIKKNGKID